MNQMFVGFVMFKLKKREFFLYILRFFHNCVLIVAFVYMCSADDDISKVLKYRVQAA